MAEPEPWMSRTESDKAWMSVRDAELLERLLLFQARRADAPLRVLEWGAGRSTLNFSKALRDRAIEHSWLAIEHHREFFVADLLPHLDEKQFTFHENLAEASAGIAAGTRRGVHVVVFDGGELRPFERGEPGDLTADLDAYVDLPASLGVRYDLVLVDGRKRRRCLLEAARLLTPHGIAVLHDAWRLHYQCAFDAFSFGRMLGDELWVGAHHGPGIETLLPDHAFRRHADCNGEPTT